MQRYIVRRLLQMIPSLILITLFIFALLRVLPGDPIYALIGEGGDGMTPAQRAAIRHDLWLDRPIHVQYLKWLGDVVQGDWGRSFKNQMPISTLIQQRLVFTVQLGLLAWLLGLAVGLPIGILSALRRNTLLDAIATTGAISGVAIPNFWMGLMLILLFGVMFPILPTYGAVSFFDDPARAARHLVLPVITLGLAHSAAVMRHTRSAVLEVLSEDYVRTARAKGLQEGVVIGVHTLRNSLLPVVTVAGVQVRSLLGGAVVTETIFGLPGLGRLAADSVKQNDYAAVQIVVLVMAMFMLTVNLVIDIVYSYLDPRIRYT